MGLSPEERYRFDVAGYFIRTEVLDPRQIAGIIEQVRTDHLSVPGGPSSILIDHPIVLDAVGELVGGDARIEDVAVRGLEVPWPRLGGIGPESVATDMHVFGYRVIDGRPRTATVRVIYELEPVDPRQPTTLFVHGSHRASLEPPASLTECPDDPLFTGYSCRAGSAVIAAEGLLRFRPPPAGLSIELVYAHPAVAYSRNVVRRELLESLSPRRQGYFRDSWQYDFSTDPPTKNVLDRFLSRPSIDGNK